MRGQVEQDQRRGVAEREGREPGPGAAAVDQPSAERSREPGREREGRDREAAVAVGAGRALDREQDRSAATMPKDSPAAESA